MKSYGTINMQQNPLQEVVLDVEQNFPANPTPGRLVFKDKVLYVCIEIAVGQPVWVPLTTEISIHTHNQFSSSAIWTVQHNLNNTSPVVQVYGSNGKFVYPDEVEIVDNNQLKIYFNNTMTGKATVLTGQASGSVTRLVDFTHVQTELSANWVINHNLDHYPIVRVFIGSLEVQPLSIDHIDNNNCVINFTEPQTGIARLL